jgi:O-antigen/teichoic acid export membrane protein
MSLILIIFAKEFYHFFYGGKYLDGVFLLQLLAITGPFFAWQSVGEGLLHGLGFPNISFSARTANTVAKVVLNLGLIYLLQSTGAVLASIISIAILAFVITRGVKTKVAFSIAGILSRFRDLKNFLKVAKLQLKSVNPNE